MFYCLCSGSIPDSYGSLVFCQEFQAAENNLTGTTNAAGTTVLPILMSVDRWGLCAMLLELVPY